MTSKRRQRTVPKCLDRSDDILFRVPKGRRAEIKAYAGSLGMSMNAYVNTLIERDLIERKLTEKDLKVSA